MEARSRLDDSQEHVLVLSACKSFFSGSLLVLSAFRTLQLMSLCRALSGVVCLWNTVEHSRCCMLVLFFRCCPLAQLFGCCLFVEFSQCCLLVELSGCCPPVQLFKGCLLVKVSKCSLLVELSWCFLLVKVSRCCTTF